ncbi:MAG: site-2 protease family protein [Ruminococcus sp.]|nr:site-2 protease family protein [Ruminococcus sp.]
MDIEVLLKYFARAMTLLLVLPLHEAAHAVVAKAFGDRTSDDRISLNPFIHLDPLGSVLMLLTGFGWAKPVHVEARNMRNPRAGMALTALAGPVSNLIAAFAAGLVKAWILSTEKGLTAVYDYYIFNKVSMLYCVYLLMEFLMLVNIGLAVFNLIPIPPLDGFGVLNYFLSYRQKQWVNAHFQEIQMGFLAFIIILNLDIIPDSVNPLYLARNGIYDLMWDDLLYKIPSKKWGWG